MRLSWLRFISVIFLILILVSISSADHEPPLKVAWKTRIGPPGYGSIDLIVSDIIYSNSYHLQAIDANNGKLLWSAKRSGSIAYNEGVIYAAVSSPTPNIHALDSRTGKEIWTKEYPEFKTVDYATEHNVIMSGDTVYIITDNPNNFGILALDTSGTVQWYKTYGGSIFSQTFSFSSDLMAVPSYANNNYVITAINITSGEILWEITGINGEPRAYQDLLFIEKGRMVDKNGVYVLSVSRSTGDTIWETRVGNSNGDILAIKENKIFVLSENIRVLDPENGEVLDEYSIPMNTFIMEFIPKAVSDQVLYIIPPQPPGFGGTSSIHAFNLYTGELLWREEIKGGNLFYHNSRLYTTHMGKLYAYEHGVDTGRQLYFGIFVIILITANLFIRHITRDTRIKNSLQFSTLLTSAAYFWFLMVYKV
ncbi:MAG: hypothetical protein E4G94_04840 [ANME-2 cluster archaeon]|nr:MAG: hypothetical protein E4G94_04840 [ANME-2 cluster archaeon]